MEDKKEEKVEEKNNDIKLFLLVILGLIAIVLFAVIITLTIGEDEKRNSNSGNNNNTGNNEIEDPINQNDVVIDGFTYSILKLETNKNNLVYSPLSVKYALSMLSEGAKGQTKEEIDKLIKDLSLTKYKNIDKVLSLANSIFIRDTYKDKIKNEYVETLKDKYNAEVIYDEFKDATNVNKWIETKTFEIIKNMLLDEQVQDEDLKIMLINALAIDMEWLNGFNNENTTSRPFTKENGEEINVAMMHKSSTVNEYYQDEDYSVLSLPLKDYNGTQLEFIAIMPNEKELNKILTSEDLTKTINNLVDKLHAPEKEELSISLPRFEFEYKASLSKDLQTMGIKEAFTYNADLSNMGTTDLYVSEVLHKANIKCSEKGVKAAAATVIMVKDNAAIMDPEEKQIVYLNFNKPFMFIIRDKNTKEVWFTGTVYEPLLWEKAKTDYKYQ